MIKKFPEDFKVRELMDLDLNGGRYTYFILKKRNYNTLDAIEKIAKVLKIDVKRFGFAGNKDKRALTEQFVSVLNISKKKLEGIKLKDLWIKLVGFGSKRINLGDLKGNEFEIKVRNIKKFYKTDFFANYFGEQRFGVEKKNHLIGKCIIMKDFSKACKLLGLKKENSIKNLVEIGRKRLLFYLHSYQSYIFNKVLAEFLTQFEHSYSLGEFVFLRKKIKNFSIPLVNFDAEFRDKKIKKIYQQILNEESIKLDDFIVREIPWLVSETVYRDAFVEVNDLRIKSDILRFSLPKGSYATVFLKKLIGL